MTEEILTKINDCVARSEYNERDVVYILVQAFKLLERDNRMKEYKAISLYRNWVCHAALTRYKVEFSPIIDEYTTVEAEGRFDPNPGVLGDRVLEKIVEYFDGKYSFACLKREIVETGYISHQVNWNSFELGLYKVIKDIPIQVEAVGDKPSFTLHCETSPELLENHLIKISVRIGRLRINAYRSGNRGGEPPSIQPNQDHRG